MSLWKRFLIWWNKPIILKNGETGWRTEWKTHDWIKEMCIKNTEVVAVEYEEETGIPKYLIKETWVKSQDKEHLDTADNLRRNIYNTKNLHRA